MGADRRFAGLLRRQPAGNHDVHLEKLVLEQSRANRAAESGNRSAEQAIARAKKVLRVTSERQEPPISGGLTAGSARMRMLDSRSATMESTYDDDAG